MSIITKEMLHSEFKEVTKKDEKSKKPSYKHESHIFNH